MAIRTRAELKAFFETGDYPTQQQFADLIDSITLEGADIDGNRVKIGGLTLQQFLNIYFFEVVPVRRVWTADAAHAVDPYATIRAIAFRSTVESTITITPEGEGEEAIAEVDLVANKIHWHDMRFVNQNNASQNLLFTGVTGSLEVAVYYQGSPF